MTETDWYDQMLERRQTREARLRALWQMSPAQRVAAMRGGKLTVQECAAWAARYPEQMPLVDGEYEYIAAFTPEARD